MGSLAFLLYPFAILYGWGTAIRNWLFEVGVFKTNKSQIPSILVGNLSVGGTGKTPMVEYLIRLLSSQKSIATLSRGYGRKSSGFLKASLDSTPEQIGDEPFQIYEKFGQEVSVFVCEDRVAGMKRIKESDDSLNLLLLDDAFQHRSLKADINIVLTTFSRPFSRDFLLPMGRLREYRKGARRADIIVVTKCPDELGLTRKNQLVAEIKSYTLFQTPVLFSRIGYGKPYPLLGKGILSENVLLVSGIADDTVLKEEIAKSYTLLDSMRFGDHHDFTAKDMESILGFWAKHKTSSPSIVITEKDADKVKSFVKEGFLAEIPIFVQPIQVQFSTEDEEILRGLIAQKVN